VDLLEWSLILLIPFLSVIILTLIFLQPWYLEDC
jgi:hypothetical protein